MTSLYLTEPKGFPMPLKNPHYLETSAGQNHLALVRILESVLRSVLVENPTNRKETRLWLIRTLGNVSISRSGQRKLFLALAKPRITGASWMGASERRPGREKGRLSLLHQLILFLCERRPSEVISLLRRDRTLVQRFFQGHPTRIALWFNHFSSTGDHRMGALALARYAFLYRSECWQELVWLGKHAQAPVSVAAKPHYLCELNVEGTIKNFLKRVPEFWASNELWDTMKKGELISIESKFFASELLKVLGEKEWREKSVQNDESEDSDRYGKDKSESSGSHRKDRRVSSSGFSEDKGESSEDRFKEKSKREGSSSFSKHRSEDEDSYRKDKTGSSEEWSRGKEEDSLDSSEEDARIERRRKKRKKMEREERKWEGTGSESEGGEREAQKLTRDLWRLIESFLEEEDFSSLCLRLLHLVSDDDLLGFAKSAGSSLRESRRYQDSGGSGKHGGTGRRSSDDICIKRSNHGAPLLPNLGEDGTAVRTRLEEVVVTGFAEWKSLDDALIWCALANHGRQVMKLLTEEHAAETADITSAIADAAASSKIARQGPGTPSDGRSCSGFAEQNLVEETGQFGMRKGAAGEGLDSSSAEQLKTRGRADVVTEEARNIPMSIGKADLHSAEQSGKELHQTEESLRDQDEGIGDAIVEKQSQCTDSWELGHWGLRISALQESVEIAWAWILVESWILRFRIHLMEFVNGALEALMEESGVGYKRVGILGSEGVDGDENGEVKRKGSEKSRKKTRKRERLKRKRKKRRGKSGRKMDRDDDSESEEERRFSRSTSDSESENRIRSQRDMEASTSGNILGWKVQLDGFTSTWTPAELTDELVNRALLAWLDWDTQQRSCNDS